MTLTTTSKWLKGSPIDAQVSAIEKTLNYRGVCQRRSRERLCKGVEHLGVIRALDLHMPAVRFRRKPGICSRCLTGGLMPTTTATLPRRPRGRP